MEPLLLTANEVGEALRLSRAMAYRLLRDGTIPTVRVGRSVRVSSERLRAWVRERDAGAAPNQGHG
jgi:excisionase family DNA binding protein